MTSNNSVIKITSKTILKNKYNISIFASLIVVFSYLICYCFCSVFATLFGDIIAYCFLGLIIIFLFTPIFFGLLRYFWRMNCCCIDKPYSVFYYFSNFSLYKRVTYFSVSLTIKTLIYGFILLIPAIIIWLISQSFIYDIINIDIPIWTANLHFVFILLRTIGIVLLFLLMLKYYIAPFLLIADENMEIGECFHLSKIISKKTTIDFIYLILSMLGFIILSLFIAPAIFTLPYIIVVYLVHCRFSVAEYNNIKLNDMNNFFAQ